MRYPKYEYSTENQLYYFEFISDGPRGQIKKIIEFQETKLKIFTI